MPRLTVVDVILRLAFAPVNSAIAFRMPGGRRGSCRLVPAGISPFRPGPKPCCYRMARMVLMATRLPWVDLAAVQDVAACTDRSLF